MSTRPVPDHTAAVETSLTGYDLINRPLLNKGTSPSPTQERDDVPPARHPAAARGQPARTRPRAG